MPTAPPNDLRHRPSNDELTSDDRRILLACDRYTGAEYRGEDGERALYLVNEGLLEQIPGCYDCFTTTEAGRAANGSEVANVGHHPANRQR
jgi:hypothetical protein